MRRLAIMGMCFVMLGSACSAGADDAADAGIPAEVAGELAGRADRVAAALDSGACDQALAEARSLQSDISGLTVDPAVKAEALAGAARLTATIACAPPTTASTAPPPAARQPGSEKGKKDKGGDKDGGDRDGDKDDD